MPSGAFLLAELEVLLNIVGEAATRLKKRLDLVYGQRKDKDGGSSVVSMRQYSLLAQWRGPFSISCAKHVQGKPPRSA